MQHKLPKPGQQTHDVTLVGARDAFHVAAVLVQADGHIDAGDYVRFVDDACTTVVYESERTHAHAVLDPFGDPVSVFAEPLPLRWVWVLPGLTTEPRHHFDLDLKTRPKRPHAAPPSPVDPPDDACGWDEDPCDKCQY